MRSKLPKLPKNNIIIESQRIPKALGCSVDGLRIMLRTERAFQQECILACILIPTACFIPVSLVFKLWMISSIFLVLIIELLNSGLEGTIDYISKQKHPLAKRVKDVGSAAVLLALLNCGLVWALALYSLL